jgi:hypothetical protein
MTMAGVVSNYGGTTGFLVWELMIGDTNTRFHWGQVPSNPATVEPATPFQGTIYPDGHPWLTSEVQALTGKGYNSLPVLNVSYYNNTTFTGSPVKTSITPALSFNFIGIPRSDLRQRLANGHLCQQFGAAANLSDSGRRLVYP